jgi:hypothetical protein
MNRGKFRVDLNRSASRNPFALLLNDELDRPAAILQRSGQASPWLRHISSVPGSYHQAVPALTVPGSYQQAVAAHRLENPLHEGRGQQLGEVLHSRR